MRVGGQVGLEQIFLRLTTGDTGGFVEQCTPEMTLTARGVAGSTVTVARHRIAAWYGALEWLAGGSLRSNVESVTVSEEEDRGVVVLSYAFERGGGGRSFRTVNFCTLGGGRLRAWFSHPANPEEYARAWGLAMPTAVGPTDRVALIR